MSQPRTSDPGWVCPLCTLSSLQQTEMSYLKHLEDLHAEESEQQTNTGSFAEWRRSLVGQAFKTNQSPVPDLRGLSLGAPSQPTPPINENRGGQRLPGGRPVSMDDFGISAASTPMQTAHPPIRPASASNIANDFSIHTLQKRPDSRETLADDNRKRKAPQQTTPQITQPPRRGVLDVPSDPRYPGLIMQPDSRGISQDQLGKEVRAIYAGLTMVEAKAISLDKAKMEAAQFGPLPSKALYGLIGVHKALLNEHHDFFLASQHPSASPGLHRLASKYSMPARMWKHGIHSFLELLRHQLPHSLEYMIQFIILAYQMMSLLLETVPSFEDTWIECLGDLSRYRMAVEDEDPKDREIWANVARYWYCKAADKMPNTGRLYHHLAILARGNPLQQLYLYSRSLTSAIPFASARESIQSLLEPAIKGEKLYFPEIDISFVKVHACLFYRKPNEFEDTLRKFQSLLDPQINKLTAKWREYGVYIAASNIGALFDFGNRNFMTQLFEIGNLLNSTTSIGSEEHQALLQRLKDPIVLDASAIQSFELSCNLFFSTLQIILQRPYDKNCAPFLHVTLSFIQTLLSFRKEQCYEHLPKYSKYVIRLFLRRTPWQAIADCCNQSLKQEEFGSRFETVTFLEPEQSESGCLPEDYLLWGLLWTQAYYPRQHFVNANADEERSIELPSTMHSRIERNLNITFRMARENDDRLTYSTKLRKWKAEEAEDDEDEDDVDEDIVMVDAPTRTPEADAAQETSLIIQNATIIIGPDILANQELFAKILTYNWEDVVIPKQSIEQMIRSSNIGSIEAEKSQSPSAIRAVMVGIRQKKFKVFDGDKDVTGHAKSLLSNPQGKEMGSLEIENMLRTAAEQAKAAKQATQAGTDSQPNIGIVSDIFSGRKSQGDNPGYWTRASETFLRMFRGASDTIHPR